MTDEELLKRTREIMAIEKGEQETPDIREEAVKETFSSASGEDRIGLHTALLNNLYKDNELANIKSEALLEAEKDAEWIKHEFDREKLASSIDDYTKKLQENAYFNNSKEYYKNQIILEKLYDRANLVSGAKEYDKDFLNEITLGLAKPVADTGLAVQAGLNNIPFNSNTNISSKDIEGLYNNNGKATTDAEKKARENIELLKANYFNDDNIQKLYDTVVKGEYKVASNEYFDALSKYATEKLKELRYYDSNIYKNTKDLENSFTKMKQLEELSGYTTGQKLVLSGLGTTAYMAPSIIAGSLAGNIAQSAGATKTTVDAIAQAGALTSMGISAYGNTMNATLDQGYGWNRSNLYATIDAIMEVATELIGGENVMAGIGGFTSHTMTSKVAQNLISKGKSPLAKWMISMAWDIGAEATEEMISSALMPLADRTILGKDVPAEEYWKGILESARDSVIPTLLLGGFGKAKIVNVVSKISNSLNTRLDEMAMNGRLTKEEYNNMTTDLKNWTDDAMAGVTEHYKEMKNELGKITYTEEYSQAMQDMQKAISSRNEGVDKVIKYATSLENMNSLTEAEKQSSIEKLAKSYGIDKTKLAEIFKDYKNVLPETYRQVERSAKAYAMTQEETDKIAKNITQKIESTELNKQTQEFLNNKYENEQPKAPPKIDKKNSNKLFVKLAKNSPAEQTASGVIRIDVNDNAPVQSFKLGTVNSNNKPTYKEIMNAPILAQVYQTPDGLTEDDTSEMKQYVYNNFADFEKDMINKYGSLSRALARAITMSGKGGYEMKVSDNGDITWERGGITIRKTGKKSLNKSQSAEKKEAKSTARFEDAKTSYDAKPTKPKETVAKKDGMYSQVEKIIVDKMANKADAQTIKNLLAKNGAKQDELNWLDMDEFLASKDTFTKEEVLDYIRANQLEFTEERYDTSEIDRVRAEEYRLTHEKDEILLKALDILSAYGDDRLSTIDEMFRELYYNMQLTPVEEQIRDLFETYYEHLPEEISDYRFGQDRDKIIRLYDEWSDLQEQIDSLPDYEYFTPENSARFKDYSTSLGGGENYREVLFTLPDFEGKPFYVRQHWKDTPNVVAHARLQDYEDEDGNSVLFIEEVQSDMHEQGRKKGYYGKEEKIKLDKLHKKIDSIKEEQEKLVNTKEYEDAKSARLKLQKIEYEIDTLTAQFRGIYSLSARNIYQFVQHVVEEQELDLEKEFDRALLANFMQGYAENYEGQVARFIVSSPMKLVEDYIDTANKIEALEKTKREYDKKSDVAVMQKVDELSKEFDDVWREISKIEGNDDLIDSRFPFKKTWHEFVLRKIINEAVENGYDKVAWTTGLQQSERYTGLVRKITSMNYLKNPDGTYDVSFDTTQAINQFLGNNLTKEQIAEKVGVDIANQITSGDFDVATYKDPNNETVTEGEIDGLELTVGSEGMSGFYDKIIPEYLNKYLKKWGSKVEDVVIKGHHQQGFEITDEMREAVEGEGQPLFEAKNVEKNKKPLYNQSRGDLNERGDNNTRIEMADGKGENTEFWQFIEKERGDAETLAKTIKAQKVSSTDSVLNNHQKSHNVKIYLIFGNQSSFVDSSGNIYLNLSQIDGYGKEQQLKHETVEDMLHRFENKVKKDFSPLIDEISKRQTALSNLYDYYSRYLSEEEKKKIDYKSTKFIKELFCDFYASTANHQTAIELKEALIKNFGQDLYDRIVSTIEKKEIQLYNLKDSNQSSFFDAKGINEFQDLIDTISAMYKESAMEQTGSPIFARTDAINQGLIPREDGRPQSALNEIANDIKHFLKGKYAKLKRNKKAYGTFDKSSGWVRSGELSNVDTQFHELGHYMQFELLDKLEQLPIEEGEKRTTPKYKEYEFSKEVIEELKKLCEARWEGKYKGRQRLSEGFAEALRLWTIDRNNLINNYRAVAEMLVTIKDKSKALQDTFKFLDKMQDKVINYENMTPLQKFDSLRKNYSTPVTVDNPIQYWATKFTFNFFNDAVYADKLDRYSAKQLGVKFNDYLHKDRIGSLLKIAGNATAIADQLQYGIVDPTTGMKMTHGFKEINESVLPTKEEAKERGTTVKKLWEQNIDDVGRYAQLRRMEYLYESDRNIKNLGMRYQEVKDAIKELLKETALTKEQLDTATDMINEDSEALVFYAYENHKISAEQRDNILSQNLFYAPLNRIIDSVEEKMIKSGGTNGFKNPTFYHLQGSDLQLENPFVALANNWGRILRSVETNNVYLKMGELAKRIKKAGGDYGLWFETDVSPVVVKKAEARLDMFKDTLRSELARIQKESKIDTLNGNMVKLMNLDATVDLFGLAEMDEDERVISYMENGKRKYIQFADNDWGKGLFRLVAGLDINHGAEWANFLQELNAPLKLGATGMNMEFALGNMQSDAMMRYITSDANFINRVYFPVITNVVNAVNYMRHRYGSLFPNMTSEEMSDMYRKFVQSGVAQSGKFVSNLENLRKNKEDVFGEATGPIFNRVRKQKGFRKPSEVMTESKLGQFLSWIPEISEQATRFAEFTAVYKKMKAKGLSEKDAIMEAGMKARLVTQDFTVQGRIMRQINKVVPFASATVGGFYRMEQEARNHPERFTIRMAGLGAFTLLISSLMTGDDRDWYDEINDQKKFDNFILPNPTGDKQHPLIIKKPQGPARAFVNLVQLLYDGGMGYIKEDEADDRTLDWFLKSIKEVSPITEFTDFMPGALIGFVENQVNYDFYYKTPIVSDELKKLDPRHQYDEYTSDTAKLIGNIFNWSPKKIDNAYEQWFAGTGKQLRNISDELIRFISGTKSTLPSKDQSEHTFASRIYANAYKNPASVDALYKRIEKLENEKAEGRMTQQQQEENNNLQTAKTIMSQYSKQIKAVRANASLTPSEKRDEIDELQGLRVDTARYYLGKKLLNSGNETSIKLTEFYPSSDTYTYNKKEVSFADEKTKQEYAEMFKKEYEANLKKLRGSTKYKKATAEEKYEMEKDEKAKARSSTTAKMKKIVYNRSK